MRSSLIRSQPYESQWKKNNTENWQNNTMEGGRRWYLGRDTRGAGGRPVLVVHPDRIAGYPSRRHFSLSYICIYGHINSTRLYFAASHTPSPLLSSSSPVIAPYSIHSSVTFGYHQDRLYGTGNGNAWLDNYHWPRYRWKILLTINN